MPVEPGDALSLAVALLAPLIVGVMVHFSLEPRARPWHSRLRKSPLRPPPPAFPLVWTYAYLAMGYASYLVYKSEASIPSVPLVAGLDDLGFLRQHPLFSPLLILYYLHYTLLQIFQFVFMGLRNLRLAFLILLLLDLFVPYVLAQWSATVPVAAYILLPYLGWLLLLTHLNYYMISHNPAHDSIGISKEEVIRRHGLPRNPEARSSSVHVRSSFEFAAVKSRIE